MRTGFFDSGCSSGYINKPTRSVWLRNLLNVIKMWSKAEDILHRNFHWSRVEKNFYRRSIISKLSWAVALGTCFAVKSFFYFFQPWGIQTGCKNSKIGNNDVFAEHIKTPCRMHGNAGNYEISCFIRLRMMLEGDFNGNIFAALTRTENVVSKHLHFLNTKSFPNNV